jgi:hypothetical protein
MTNFGYKPDPEDEQDLALPVPGERSPLPLAVDYRYLFPPAMNQGEDPACVGFAVAAALRVALRLAGYDDFPVSPYAIWYWARSLEGEEELSDGTHVRSALKAVMKLGIPAAADFEGLSPHIRKPKHNKAPGARVLMNAYKFRGVRGYYRVRTVTDMKIALASKKLVVFGIDVDEAFLETDQIRPIDLPFGDIVGGHAMVATGYDDSDNTMWIANSMGRRWREEGFAKMSQQMMAKSRDRWAIDVSPKT